ncbi:hypothetical protein [Bradyrhizobium tropiciagri]|uniref:hypothetical protein n=1 Tax=Bradyrhizobium tropiciagri TaxID=312253 RepID=UPI00138F2ADA|nr:hypothetical protein [Bradyrhizobium tropiciagri]
MALSDCGMSLGPLLGCCANVQRAPCIELYVGAGEMNLRCCASAEHESYEQIADRRRVRARWLRKRAREAASHVDCVSFACCKVHETAGLMMNIANIPAGVLPTTRTLLGVGNKAEFVSLTEPRSLLRFATSKRGSAPCRNPIPTALPAKRFA